MDHGNKAEKTKKKHKPENCPALHIKNCPGCSRSCACYARSSIPVETDDQIMFHATNVVIKLLEREAKRCDIRAVTLFTATVAKEVEHTMFIKAIRTDIQEKKEFKANGKR